MQRYYSWAWLALGGAAVSPSAWAQTQIDPVGLSVSGSIEVRNVENAGLVSKSEDQVSEIQTIASLTAEGQLQGSWAGLVTNYSIEDRRYSEFEEDDERVILGDSVLTFGPQRRNYYLELSHSSREVSLDPLSADRPANRDNRVFLSGVLYGSVTPGRGNALGAWVGATEIQFDESKENEARRHNVGVSYERDVSPLSKAGLSVTGYDLEYINLDDSDLRYSRVAATWRTELRRLSYGMEIGSNRIESDTDTVTSPSVAADLAYTSGPQSMRVSYNQFLSDTSQGSQMSSEVSPITDVEVDGRLAGVIDQFKLQQFAFSWGHSQICSVCTAALDLGVDEESYVNYPELDSRELSVRLQFAYRASSAVSLSVRGGYQDFEELNVQADGGYEQASVDLTISFPRLIRDGQLDLLAGQVRRSFEARESYESTFAGVRFRYLFF